MNYLRGGLALERFLPLGVEGADILFLRFKHDQQTHVSKSAGNRSGDRHTHKGFWMHENSPTFPPLLQRHSVALFMNKTQTNNTKTRTETLFININKITCGINYKVVNVVNLNALLYLFLFIH